MTELGRIGSADRAGHEPSQSPLSRPCGDHPLRVLSLFAGIGGFDLGLERTGGFETVAVAELDPYASKVLALRFPGVPNVGDVTTAEYPDADFICAGFPCQDISFAGAGAGLAGERSGLWREVVRAIRVVRPRGTLLENVAALLGRGLDTVLGDLAEVGHDAEWHCIPARSIGAPHIRDRIWIFTQPQHPNADRAGSHRAPVNVDGDAEPAHQQICLSGPLGALLADTARQRRGEARRFRHSEQAERASGCGEDVADTSSAGQPLSRPEPNGQDGEQGGGVPTASGWWAVEPNVGRVANGIPKRVDRLRCLGNAVVPQIPELIGNAILASLSEQRDLAA